MFDGKAFGAEVVKIVKGYLKRHVAPLDERIAKLETAYAELLAKQPEHGEKGDRGEPGLPGEPGERGLDGKDGIGLAGAVIDREGNLVVTLTDGTTKSLGCVVGRDGEPGLNGKDGTDGADGLGFDDLEVIYNSARTFTFKFHRSDLVKEFNFDLPVMLYAGVFNERAKYNVGDAVTYGGSLWHCDVVETKEKPGDASKHWTLIAKRGRDGKDGIPGMKGERGLPGLNGQDATPPLHRLGGKM